MHFVGIEDRGLPFLDAMLWPTDRMCWVKVRIWPVMSPSKSMRIEIEDAREIDDVLDIVLRRRLKAGGLRALIRAFVVAIHKTQHRRTNGEHEPLESGRDCTKKIDG